MKQYEALNYMNNLMTSDRKQLRAYRNYARLEQFINSGQFTSDNEVFQQLQYAKNNRDFNRLYAAAIQRQQEINDYNRQLADNAALRDEQRAYEDPRAQIARERAAGLNPDLIDGAGLQAPSSPITAPDIDAAQVPALSDPAETFGLIMQGVSTASSVFTALSGGLNSFLEFSKGAATFGDVVSGIKSDSLMKKTAADLAAGLKPHQISSAQSAARSAEVAADVAEGTSSAQQAASLADAAQKRLLLVGDMASQFTDVDYNDDIILGQAVSDYLGLSVDDPRVQPLVRQLKRYNSSPQKQKDYKEARLAHLTQNAINESRPYELILEVEKARVDTELFQQRADLTAASFEETFKRLTQTPENAEVLSSGFQSQIKTAQLTSELEQKQAARDLQVYMKNLSYQASELANMDKLLAEMRSNPSKYSSGQYAGLLLKRNSLALLQTREMHRVNQLVQDFYLTNAKTEYMQLSGQNNVSMHLSEGYFTYLETLFSPDKDVELPPEKVTSKFKAIIQSIPQLKVLAKFL